MTNTKVHIYSSPAEIIKLNGGDYSISWSNHRSPEHTVEVEVPIKIYELLNNPYSPKQLLKD